MTCGRKLAIGLSIKATSIDVFQNYHRKFSIWERPNFQSHQVCQFIEFNLCHPDPETKRKN